jgi:hypothetical protein
MRLALIDTIDFGFAGWEIHTSECDEVTKSIHRGSFAAIVSAGSPEALMESEIAARAEQGWEARILRSCLVVRTQINAQARRHD